MGLAVGGRLTVEGLVGQAGRAGPGGGRPPARVPQSTEKAGAAAKDGGGFDERQTGCHRAPACQKRRRLQETRGSALDARRTDCHSFKVEGLASTKPTIDTSHSACHRVLVEGLATVETTVVVDASKKV